jgi:hypothetical protein
LTFFSLLVPVLPSGLGYALLLLNVLGFPRTLE